MSKAGARSGFCASRNGAKNARTALMSSRNCRTCVKAGSDSAIFEAITGLAASNLRKKARTSAGSASNAPLRDGHSEKG
jgi:hypothetical protein